MFDFRNFFLLIPSWYFWFNALDYQPILFSEVYGLIPKQMFLKMRSFDFSNDAFDFQNLYPFDSSKRNRLYSYCKKKKKRKKSGIKYSRIKRKKSMDPRFESQAYWFSFSRNRLRIYRTYTVWQYFHRFLCDTQRNFSKQKLQQNLICKNWLNYNVRYNIV